MNTISNMVEKRNKAWQGAKAFLESKCDKDGLISEEDAKTYDEMEAKVKAYSMEIERLEQMEVMDKELSKPTSETIVAKPMKTGVKHMIYQRVKSLNEFINEGDNDKIVKLLDDLLEYYEVQYSLEIESDDKAYNGSAYKSLYN